MPALRHSPEFRVLRGWNEYLSPHRLAAHGLPLTTIADRRLVRYEGRRLTNSQHLHARREF